MTETATKQRRPQGSAKPFTDKGVKALGEGPWADSGCRGLYLVVRGGSRLWMHRYKQNGVAHWLTLGRMADVPLADARERVNANRAALRRGVDLTKTAISARGGSTLQDDINDLYEHAHRQWDEAYAAGWKACFGHLGKLLDKPTPLITSTDLRDALRDLWVEKHTTADRILRQLKAVIDRAVTLDENGSRFGKTYRSPVKVARELLPKTKRSETPHVSMPYSMVPGFYGALMTQDSTAAKALAFLLGTGTPRLSEVLPARWQEIDLDAATWTVPAGRMKSGKSRSIPLVPAMVRLLNTIRPIECNPEAYIFRGRGGAHISEFVVRDVKNRLGAAEYDIHGFRSSFKDWVLEHGAVMMDLPACERCLDHAIGNSVQERYRRSDLIEQRRDLLTRWVAHLDSGTVVRDLEA